MSGYDLELNRMIDTIKEKQAKKVCIQLPEGLRPMTEKIVGRIEAETGAVPVVWLGSCYGACDTPIGLDDFGVDLLIQWGHSAWSS